MIGKTVCAIIRLFGGKHKEKRILGTGHNRECKRCGARRQTRARKVDDKTADLFVH